MPRFQPPWSSLDEVARDIKECPLCDLCKSRINAVPGEGPTDPEILFVGEAPGFNEDKQGRPFVGAAGGLLNNLLGLAGLERRDVFITNVVKCRPPNNRDPQPDEVNACRDYLEAQIGFMKPKLIVTLGRHSLGWFFPGESVTKARGKPRKWRDYTVLPTLHPAAALHQARYREPLEEDFRALPALVKKLQREANPGPAGPAASPPPDDPPSQQLSMF